MKMKYLMKSVLIISLLILFSLPSQSEAEGSICSLRGKVIDKTTKRPIAGGVVTAIVDGNAITRRSDSYGKYRLRNIPIGRSFPMKVTAQSYSPLQVKSIECRKAGDIVPIPPFLLLPLTGEQKINIKIN